MRLLCLDVGDRRVGIAFGDSTVRIATPVDVLTRVSLAEDARAFALTVRKYDPEKLIVGLPRNMDGTIGTQAQSVMTYIEPIANALKLPFEYWDERLTTMAAMERRNETGARGKKSRVHIDALAAAVILQDYLDSQRNDTE
jgi:putative holliday junction resolvase